MLRSADYLKGLHILLAKHPTRVVHNSLLIVFALAILPPGQPDALICTKATMWAMPEVSSALYVAQFSDSSINNAIARVSNYAGIAICILIVCFRSSEVTVRPTIFVM